MSDMLLRLYQRLPGPARSAAATLRGAYLRAWRYGAATEQLVEEALAREHWTPEQWQQWRDRRLAALLERAATRVPYYRAHWQMRRGAGDRASWELLQNWPVLEKEALRARPRDFLADDCRPGDLLREQTSGTTGTPLSIYKSRATLQQLYALAAARTRRSYGVSRRDRWARLGGQLVTPLAQRRPPFWVWNAAGRQLYMSTFHLAPAFLPAYLDALVRYGIVALVGYPSALYALAQEALRVRRDDLRIRVVVTNAEPLPDDQRAIIAEAFRCPVRATYGMNENVAAASECEAGRLHQWPEVGLIEVQEEEFICTGLLNADMPLIRYRIGDRGRLAPAAELCACGRTLPRIDAVDGRSADALLTPDGRRVFWLNPVWYGLPVRQGQIVQDSLARVRVRFVPAPEFTPAAARTIVTRLEERLGPVEVVLEPVDEIPRTRGGKARAVICNVAAAGATCAARPVVSVVVPCLNERRYIAACLDSILATDYPHDRMEVLVVDGMSDDGTRQIVAGYAERQSRLSLVDNPRRITPAALNVGIRAARGEIIVRMDAHVVYPPDYLPRSVGALEETGADNVGGVVVTRASDDGATARAIALALSHPFGVGNARFRIGSRERRWVDTLAFGCFRRATFARVGLFDEELVRNQDDEFNFRLAKHGGRVLLEPGVVAYYYARTSLRQVARMWYQYGYFKPLVARKIGRVVNGRQLAPACFVVLLATAAALSPLHAAARLVLELIGGAYVVLSLGCGVAAARREGPGCGLLLPCVFLVMHLSYGVGFLHGVARHLLRLGRRPATLALSR